jgi:hypothetical protein
MAGFDSRRVRTPGIAAGLQSHPNCQRTTASAFDADLPVKEGFLTPKTQGPDSFSEIRALAAVFALERRLMRCLSSSWISVNVDSVNLSNRPNA